MKINSSETLFHGSVVGKRTRISVLKVSLFIIGLAILVTPCGAIPVQRSVAVLMDNLAREFLAGKAQQSRVRVGVLTIKDGSPLAKRHEVGATVKALVEHSIDDSLVFKLVERSTLEASLKEIERILSDPKGQTRLDDRTIENISYFLTGSVTEEDNQFRLTLRLVKSDTAVTAASASISFPITELVAYGDIIYKPFGLVGVYGTAAFDLNALTSSTYSDVVGFVGSEVLFPLKFMYVRVGTIGHYAEGERSDVSWYPAELGYGTNKVLALIGYLGIGSLIPVAPNVFGHIGLDFGTGFDKKNTLYKIDGSDEYFETDFNALEGALFFSLSTGAAFKLSETVALDVQVGLGGMTLGLYPEATAVYEGSLNIPLRITLAYPF